MIPFPQFEAVLKTRETEKIIKLVNLFPGILSETNQQGISGLLLIAYHQLPAVLEAVLPLKQPLTLYEALACGQTKIVQEYMEKDASLLNQPAPDGFPPLSLACYFGHEDLAIYLIDLGADVNAVATNGTNIQALHAAVARNNVVLCKLLLEKGAAVNATQTQGVTALHSAVRRGNLELVQLLVANQADINAQMDNGDTAIFIAEREKHPAISAFLNGG